MFHGHNSDNILDLKVGIRPAKFPPPDSQIAQDVLEQTGMIFQDVSKNAMQASIKDKAYFDKKSKASKPKQADHVYIVQPKADLLGKNSFYRFSVDGTIHYWKGVTEL